MDEAIDMTITLDRYALLTLVKAHFEREGYTVNDVVLTADGGGSKTKDGVTVKATRALRRKDSLILDPPIATISIPPYPLFPPSCRDARAAAL